MGTRDHYLQRPQIAIIFLSFVLLTLPLTYAQVSPAIPFAVGGPMMLAYVVLIGNTHFAITGALYLNSNNLRYFRSSTSRAFVYLLAPAAILVVMSTADFLELVTTYRWIFIPFTVGVAAADRFHVVRQSFGVFQMFKARAGASFPRSLRTVDNSYFLTLWALQLMTFTNNLPHDVDGAVDLRDPATRGAALLALALFGAIVRGLYAEWRKPEANRRATEIAFVYLLLQSASALLAVYRTRLYLASLAMHYVEYHVLIAPRLFATPLDLSSRVDRAAAMFRRHKVAFYVLLASLSAAMSAGALLGVGGIDVTRDSSQTGWLFVNLLNGIFLAHYFVDAFVWKFGNPFYRETLGPLYFAKSRAMRTSPLYR